MAWRYFRRRFKMAGRLPGERERSKNFQWQFLSLFEPLTNLRRVQLKPPTEGLRRTRARQARTTPCRFSPVLPSALLQFSSVCNSDGRRSRFERGVNFIERDREKRERNKEKKRKKKKNMYTARTRKRIERQYKKANESERARDSFVMAACSLIKKKKKKRSGQTEKPCVRDATYTRVAVV